MSYTGNHKKIAAYGSIAEDGRRTFRTYDRFNKFIFIKYFKELQRRCGKVAVITDRASSHRVCS